jgi:hypothetical protein
VLCNLHAQAHPETAAKQTEPNYYLGCQTFVPPAVARWAGLNKDNGTLLRPIKIGSHRYDNLAEINDGTNLSFAKIADIIDDHGAQL